MNCAYRKDMSEATAKDSHYARLRRQHRDRLSGGGKRKDKTAIPALMDMMPGRVRLYGLHTVSGALANPRRKCHHFLVTQNAYARLELDKIDLPIEAEFCTPRQIEHKVGSDAVHQGIMLEADALPVRPLSALNDSHLILILDQVTDPHNVGAIMRSAVAFNAGALITTTRHAPQETGVVAKAASGALELIDHISVRNLGQTLAQLHQMGFTSLGLDSAGGERLESACHGKKIALVLGAEGKGLRQKTKETVNILARLDMPGQIKALNVSNAAALALYVAHQFLA